MLYGKLKTPARDRRTSSVFCAWVAPWQCFVLLSFLRVGCSVLVCIWGAAGWFWRRFGAHLFLEQFWALGAPFLVILRVWRVSRDAFGPHLESDSKKYENRPKKWCQKYSDLGASWGNFRSCLRLKVRSETEPIFATVLGSVWARFWTSCWAKVS